MYSAPNFPEGCRLLVYIFWRIKFLDLCFVQNSLAKWIYFYFLWGKSFFQWRNLNSSLICQAEDCLHNSRLIQYGFLIFIFIILQIFRFQSWDLMRNGVAPLNAILVGSVISSLYPVIYKFPDDNVPYFQMWVFLCIGAFQR